MKIDWKRKLSSRKFWALLAAIAVSCMAMLRMDAGTSESVVGVIGSVGACVCYMLAEGRVDAKDKDDTPDTKSDTKE